MDHQNHKASLLLVSKPLPTLARNTRRVEKLQENRTVLCNRHPHGVYFISNLHLSASSNDSQHLQDHRQIIVTNHMSLVNTVSHLDSPP